MVSEELDELTGEERHQIYRMLRLRVRVLFDDTIEAEGVLHDAISTPMDTRLRILQSTNSSQSRFCSRLTKGRMPRLELTRALRRGIAFFVCLEGGCPTYHARTFRRRSCVPQAP
jgi:hypothetical protein